MKTPRFARALMATFGLITKHFSTNTIHHPPPPPPQKNQYDDEAVVFVGNLIACWGHEITDDLRHFWFYFDEKYANLKNLKFVFSSGLTRRIMPPSDNFFTLLETIGIPKNKLHFIKTPTIFSKVFVPDECFFSDFYAKKRFYTKEYLNLLNRLPQLPAPKNLNVEKVYFSRLAFQIKKDCNEKDIENCFKEQGFTIIYPEQLNFLDELAILQHCKIFAATEGSIAHNLIFCQNGITTIICRKITGYFAEHQMLINQLKNANVTYIDVGFSPFLYRKNDWYSGPYFLYKTKELRRFFYLPPQKIFPFWKFFKYFMFYIDHKYFIWTHPIRRKLKIGTHLRQLLKTH